MEGRHRFYVLLACSAGQRCAFSFLLICPSVRFSAQQNKTSMPVLFLTCCPFPCSLLSLSPMISFAAAHSSITLPLSLLGFPFFSSSVVKASPRLPSCLNSHCRLVLSLDFVLGVLPYHTSPPVSAARVGCHHLSPFPVSHSHFASLLHLKYISQHLSYFC